MMKKGLLIIVILMCLIMTGCTNKKENTLTGGWETILSNRVNDLSEEDIYNFNNAIKDYSKEKLEVVALLGKQVVAGTNYMFLAKTDNKYKIVIVYTDLEGISKVSKVSVYTDLEGISKVSKVSDFDYSKFVNKDLNSNNEMLSGGWYTESSNIDYKLEDEKIEKMYESATKELTGVEYKPLLVVGKQIVSGTNYAILCYGKPIVPNATTDIYLMTIYNDLNGNSEITGISYINLAEYN